MSHSKVQPGKECSCSHHYRALKRIDEQGQEIERKDQQLADLLEAFETVMDQYMNAPSNATFGDGIVDQHAAFDAIAKVYGTSAQHIGSSYGEEHE